ncbi:MAG: NUDIX domain-containing protein [Ilumatobacter sp.]
MTHRTTDAPLDIRRATRALILDRAGHVLLVRFEFPTASIWALPGGGLDDGETVEGALRRELREELGLTDFEIGPHIWNREHIIPMSTGHDGQRDAIHLVHLDRFEPEPEIGWERMRAEGVHEIRWWSLDDLATSDLLFAPRALHRLLTQLVADGAPSEPVDTGV